MEVTRTNFQQVLEELDSVLPNATFLAIDGEFTGLNSGPEAKPFDTPAQYYAKLRQGSMDFLLVQFGLSVFTHNPETNKYSQRSYNFYVFPKPLNRVAPDCRFMCQASSMVFLADQGFDFNKLFNLGIPYLTSNDEEKMTKKVQDRQRVREEGLELIPINDGDKPQIEEICTKIDEFLSSDATELSIDRCNAFIRRLVHQESRIRWPKKLRIEAGPMQTMAIHKMGTPEEEKRKEVERRKFEEQEVKTAVGLSALLRKIADSGKVIVGHNMLLDLCHIIHQFFGPLPESYQEFKSLIHGLFPRLLDTKLICTAAQLKEKIPMSVLDVIYETVGKEPFVIPEIEAVEGRSYSTSSTKFHEAGYDAYITGLCFIALTNYLGSSQQSTTSMVLPSSPILEPFLNKLLIIRLKDFPHIDLVGNDPIPKRDHIFHITFPKEWKTSDLSQIFHPFGGAFVSWLSDSAAFAVLNKREHASTLLKKLHKEKRMQKCKIQSYADYQTFLEGKVENHGDRKRKSPSEIASTTPENTTNVDDKSDDSGWEKATGKKVKNVTSSKLSQSEIPSFSQIPVRLESSKNRHALWHRTEACSTSTRSEVHGDGARDKRSTLSPPTEYRNDRASTTSSTREFHDTWQDVDDERKYNLWLEKTYRIRKPSPKVGTSPKRRYDKFSTNHRDELQMKKQFDEVDGCEGVELNRPTLKLLKSTKRKETIFNASLLIRLAQVAGVILVVCYVVIIL